MVRYNAYIPSFCNDTPRVVVPVYIIIIQLYYNIIEVDTYFIYF